MLFFFNDTATTEIYTLSLHDALPISPMEAFRGNIAAIHARDRAAYLSHYLHTPELARVDGDRKSTRLNSSHVRISYAVFCLKKKNRNHLNSSHETGRWSPATFSGVA